MTSCDLDTSVPDWIIEHPKTLAVFRELGTDYCCGGKSLAYACQEQGLDGQVVLSRLHRCLRNEGKDTSTAEREHGNSPCEPG